MTKDLPLNGVHRRRLMQAGALLTLTGVYSAYLRIGTLQALVSTPYGWALIVKLAGPRIRRRPWARSQAPAASKRALATAGASTHSKKPQKPVASP